MRPQYDLQYLGMAKSSIQTSLPFSLAPLPCFLPSVCIEAERDTESSARRVPKNLQVKAKLDDRAFGPYFSMKNDVRSSLSVDRVGLANDRVCSTDALAFDRT